MCEFARSAAPYRFPLKEAREVASAGSGSLQLVRFTGGEPLLHRELPAIVAAFATSGLMTSVITNGGSLAERRGELVAAGLDQVVVSLDSPEAADHDRFRQTPGLFERAVAGISAIRTKAPQIRTRVNTVAGPHNVGQLPEMFDLLARLGVGNWSIIPLKAADGSFRYPHPERALAHYRRFQEFVADRPGPRLVGYSANWMGRTEDEVRRYMVEGRPMTPRGPCRVVDLVRYYTPRSGESFPCNCIPHRQAGMEFATPWRQDLEGGAPAAWLREHGPSTCTGCEPANAALGDGASDLTVDPFAF
jgi:cytosylglucuronate decarboxylase